MIKRLLALLLVITLLISIFPEAALAGSGTISSNGIYDISSYGNNSTITINTGLAVTLTNTTGTTYTNMQIECRQGVALTFSGVKINNRSAANACSLSFTGNANRLILLGNSNIESGQSQPGIKAETGTSLEISGTGSITTTGGENAAGIGGMNSIDCGAVTILDGTITANGGGFAAGIGGGNGGTGGTIIISGGTINATGGNTNEEGSGAGIGGGSHSDGGQITIVSGNIHAVGGDGAAGIGGGISGSGGNITVEGGTVEATGIYMSTGIGGGYKGNGGTITIRGGDITAEGEDEGSGIGGSSSASYGTISIEGGVINATGGDCSAGIGGGPSSTGGVINISGGTIVAQGGPSGAGIGGGINSESGSIDISGGNIRAIGGDNNPFDPNLLGGAGIGGGHGGAANNVTIEGGTIFAQKGQDALYDIGYGEDGSGGSLSISGDSAVFVRNGLSITPVTTTHILQTAETITDHTAFGHNLPETWTAPVYAYLKQVNRYSLNYNANGGDGAVPSAVTQDEGTTVEVADGNGLVKGVEIFWKWNTQADGLGEDYLPEDTFEFTADTTLYAIYENLFSQGDGSVGSPYGISIPEQLNAVRYFRNAHFIMMNDINMSDSTSEGGEYWNDGAGWEPIGEGTTPFTGVFDGGGYQIIGLIVNRPEGVNELLFVGLFGKIADDAEIKNIGMIEIKIIGTGCVGGIVASATADTIISNCYVSGSISTEVYESVVGTGAGGIVGASSGEINCCYNISQVHSDYYAGGIAGGVGYGGTINNCYNAGDVSAGYRCAGITCVSDGSIIKNCYNIGSTDGMYAIAADTNEDTYSNCYYIYNDFHATDGSSFSEFINVEAKTIGEMQLQSSFTGFDFENVWTMNGNEDYPCPELKSVEHVEPSNNTSEFASGNGLPYNPYIISTPEHLDKVRNHPGAWFILISNIDLSAVTSEGGIYYHDGLGWDPIGDEENFFYGRFDGCGYSVLGCNINRSQQDYVGLFGYIENFDMPAVQNLNIYDCTITGHNYTAAVVGYTNSIIKSCYFEGIVNGNNYTAGIVGRSYKCNDCENAGSVSGYRYIGGITAYNTGIISNCTNSGDIAGTNNYVGGILGHGAQQIVECKNTGCITGDRYIGGVVGSDTAVVTSCGNDGPVTGISYVGGIIGSHPNRNQDITYCYNTGTISATSYCGGIVAKSDYCTISFCYNTGWIWGNLNGGIAGSTEGNISNCFNIGKITDAAKYGGIAGEVHYLSSVDCCYNAWNQYGDDIYGFIIDSNETAVMTNCYYLYEGTESLGDEAKTFGELCHQATFENFNFADVWQIIEGERFPTLQGVPFEYTTGFNLDRDSMVMEPDTIVYIIPSVLPEDASCRTVIWTSSDENVAIIDGNNLLPVNEQMRLTAISAGSATITAKSLDGGFIDTCEVTVRAEGEHFFGSGSGGDPYQISSAGDLQQLSALVNAGDVSYTDKYYVQTQDIDLSSIENWTPIGGYGTAGKTFDGNYDGNGHLLTGLNINKVMTGSLPAYQGLFGYVKGTIKNLDIESGNITITAVGSAYVGGIAGFLKNGTIQNCNSAVYLNITGGYNSTGGIAGYSFTGTIENCGFTGSVEAIGDETSTRAGGIAGLQRDGAIIRKCYNSGSIYAHGYHVYAGGIVGCATTAASNLQVIGECYNTGSIKVKDSDETARCAGIVATAHHISIYDCFNAGEISEQAGSSYRPTIGGIVGKAESGTISNCYNIGALSGGGPHIAGIAVGSSCSIDCCYYADTCAVGIFEGTGTVYKKTLEQMKQEAVYTGFDFNNIWTMNGELSYPYPELQNVAQQPFEVYYDLSDYGNNSIIPLAPPLLGQTVVLTNNTGVTFNNVQIICEPGVSLTLNNVRIDNTLSSNSCALSFSGNDNTLILEGESSLFSHTAMPGIEVGRNTYLEITGDGSLEVTGGTGIGARVSEAGQIVISSGTINAIANGNGAGIGGTLDGEGGYITIAGGIIKAESAKGAGIGGGYSGGSCQIDIQGGEIEAKGGTDSAGIGGSINSFAGFITISGGIINASGEGRAAGIGGGYENIGGEILIDGGIIYTQSGEQGVNDIGNGLSPEWYSTLFEITGDSKIFLKHGTSVDPQTVTHVKYTDNSVTGHTAFGLSIPDDWTVPVYAYLNSDNTFSINYNANGGSGSAPQSVSKYRNTSTAVADGSDLVKNRLNFICWNTQPDGSGQRYNAGDIYTFTATITLYAMYEDPVHVASITLSSDSGTIIRHDTLVLDATVLPANATYPEVTWSSSNTAAATVDQNGKVTAVGEGNAVITAFADGKSDTCNITVTPRQFTISASSGNITYGKVTGGRLYGAGDTVTLTATPNPGYRFIRWTEGGKAVSTSTVYTFTVTSNRTLVAEFGKVSTTSAISAVSAGYSSIRVSWSTASGASGYQVYRSTSSGGTYTLLTTTSSTTYTDTGLSTGKTYYYKVCAYINAGSSKVTGGFSAVVSAVPVPSQVTGISAAMYYSTSIKVSWSAISGRSGYVVERSTSPTSGFKVIKSTSSTYYKNTGLTTNTKYYYRVRAYRNVGRSKVYGPYSVVVSDTPRLAKVTGVKASVSSATKVKISWSSLSGESGYEILRSTSPTSGFTAVDTTTRTYWYNSNITPNTTYYYKVRAYRTISKVKRYGEESAVVSVRPMFATVSGAKASMYSVTSVKVTWGSVSGRKGYEVWRSESPDRGYAYVSSTTSTYYINKSLVPNKTYYYRIRAYVMVGKTKYYSGDSNTASAMPVLGPATGVTASASSSTSCKLTWKSVSGRSGCEILRSTSLNGTYSVIGSTTKTYYYDKKCVKGTTYYYKLRAYVTVKGVRCYGLDSAAVSVIPA